MNELFSLLYLQTSTKKRNTGCDKEGGVSLFGVLFHVLHFKCWSCFVAFLSDFASSFPTEPGSYLLFANLLHLTYGCSFSYLTYLYLLISKICSFGTLVLGSYIWVLSSLLKKGKKQKQTSHLALKYLLAASKTINKAWASSRERIHCPKIKTKTCMKGP